VLLRFKSGARGAFTVSQASAGAKNGLRLQVDAATAAISWDQERPERAWVGRRGAPNLELVRDPETLHPAAAALSRLPAGHPEGWRDALRNLCVDFYASASALRDGRDHESRVATFAEGHLGMQLVEAVMESAQEQRWTRVGAASTMRA
jgi:predicted dehydrogenase